MTEAKRTVTIDNKKYDYDSFSDDAKAQLNNVRIADAEIGRLQTLLGITQTARSVYTNILKAELEKSAKGIQS